MTYGQVDLSCGQFCLSKKTVCSCTVTEMSLRWELVNGSDDIGERSASGADLNKPKILLSSNPSIRSNFEINVTEYTSETITATMSFITMSEYQGYDIRCVAPTSSDMFTIPITFPGIN